MITYKIYLCQCVGCPWLVLAVESNRSVCEIHHERFGGSYSRDSTRNLTPITYAPRIGDVIVELEVPYDHCCVSPNETV